MDGACPRDGGSFRNANPHKNGNHLMDVGCPMKGVRFDMGWFSPRLLS